MITVTTCNTIINANDPSLTTIDATVTREQTPLDIVIRPDSIDGSGYEVLSVEGDEFGTFSNIGDALAAAKRQSDKRHCSVWWERDDVGVSLVLWL